MTLTFRLSGLSPFMGDLDNDTLTNVIKVDYSFDFDEFDKISDLAKNFIGQLLQKDKRSVNNHTAVLFIDQKRLVSK